MGDLFGKFYECYHRLKKQDEGEAMNSLARRSPGLIFFGLVTLTGTHRIPLDFRMCSASTVSVIFLEHPPLFLPTTWFVHDSFPAAVFSAHSPDVSN